MSVNEFQFKGQTRSLKEITKYYEQKGIRLSCESLTKRVKIKVNEMGSDAITEDVMVECVKDALKRVSLMTVDADFKTNCIKEFGTEFWTELLQQKEEHKNKLVKNRYPFHNKQCSINEILRYYKSNGINISSERLRAMIRMEKAKTENEEITPEVLMKIIKKQITKYEWSQLTDEEKAFCIKEFNMESKGANQCKKNEGFRKSMQSDIHTSSMSKVGEIEKEYKNNSQLNQGR